jgi:hypothetical protein
MKFQFSLATLLVCTTVLAVVCAFAVSVPVRLRHWDQRVANLGAKYHPSDQSVERSPTPEDIGIRLTTWGPLAIVATLAILWAIRRLKSRCHTELPVG